MSNLPCLLLCYSRFEGFKRVFETCISNGIVDFYIAIDGPSNNDVLLIQNEICEYIKARAAKEKIEVRILYRKKNWGAAVSIITAVDWFFEQVDFGCVFEDDLEIGDDFFYFARINLAKFKNDDDVWMISGNQFVDLNAIEIESNNWTNYPLIWGWAGWASKWVFMKKAIFSDKNFPDKLSFNKTRNFLQVGAARAYAGRIDAWDVPLAYEMWNLGKFALLPNVNLVSNIGNDEYAIHTKTYKFPLHAAIKSLKTYNPSSNNKVQIAGTINRKIEKLVFMVNKRHIFLPLWIYINGQTKKSKSVNLEIRILDYIASEQTKKYL